MKPLLLVGAALLLMAAAPAPVTDGDYKPVDKDERGLWMQMDEQERLLATSHFVVRDPALNAYVHAVLCKTVGDACQSIRVYLVRTPYFNASMAPNGMMQIWTGLFLRIRNEAQLAAVIGHEYTHYRNRHSLQLFRDIKSRAGVAAWLGGFGLIGSLVSLSVISGAFEFSRDMEREADANSVSMLAAAGYDPVAASLIWQQMRAEMDETAKARGTKSRKDKNGGMFASHPPTAERLATLKALAEKESVKGDVVNAEAYRTALAGHWDTLIDDQIKLNDFGATDYLLTALAVDGWSVPLLYARGELYRSRGRPEDLRAAAGFYRQAVDGSTPASPQCWRGLGLALLRLGERDEAVKALNTYLMKQPDASDRAMIAMLAGGK